MLLFPAGCHIDFRKELELEVAAAKATAYAPSTVKNLRSQWRGYLLFCLHARVNPAPITPTYLCCYIVFLARSVKSYQTIKNYLNSVRLFHLCHGVPYNLSDNFEVKLVLRSLKGKLRTAPKQKLPITVDILRKIHRCLDMRLPFHVVLWCSFIICFFAFLRKSNIVPESAAVFDQEKHLTRSSIQVTDYGLHLKIKWSKTIQFHERELLLPLTAIPGSILCPKAAYLKMCSLIKAPGDSPAFVYPAGRHMITLTHKTFVLQLRRLLGRCGLSPMDYSGHSFRRGACTMGFEAGVSPELLRCHGDWRSNAYTRYLHFDLKHRLVVTSRMADLITNQATTK